METVVEGILESLKANVSKATETLVRLLDSEKETVQIRAAENIIEFTQKSMELEDFEERISALGEAMKETRKNFGGSASLTIPLRLQSTRERRKTEGEEQWLELETIEVCSSCYLTELVRSRKERHLYAPRTENIGDL